MSVKLSRRRMSRLGSAGSLRSTLAAFALRALFGRHGDPSHYGLAQCGQNQGPPKPRQAFLRKN